jgi:hypothetical protein
VIFASSATSDRRSSRSAHQALACRSAFRHVLSGGRRRRAEWLTRSGNWCVISGVLSLSKMGLRRSALVLLGIVASALVVTLPAGAKEGVKATLATSIPLDARAGTQLKVAWKLFSVDDQGKRQPFGANGVFVRLLSASGADAEEGFAPSGAYATGEYTATVTVPEDGIRDVELGLMGWQSGATGTRRADLIFPITNDPVPGAAPIVSPTSGQPASQRPGSDSTTWVFIAVAGALSALAILAAALVVHRKRRQPATLSYQRRTASS